MRASLRTVALAVTMLSMVASNPVPTPAPTPVSDDGDIVIPNLKQPPVNPLAGTHAMTPAAPAYTVETDWKGRILGQPDREAGVEGNLPMRKNLRYKGAKKYEDMNLKEQLEWKYRAFNPDEWTWDGKGKDTRKKKRDLSSLEGEPEEDPDQSAGGGLEERSEAKNTNRKERLEVGYCGFDPRGWIWKLVPVSFVNDDEDCEDTFAVEEAEDEIEPTSTSDDDDDCPVQTTAPEGGLRKRTIKINEDAANKFFIPLFLWVTRYGRVAWEGKPNCPRERTKEERMGYPRFIADDRDIGANSHGKNPATVADYEWPMIVASSAEWRETREPVPGEPIRGSPWHKAMEFDARAP